MIAITPGRKREPSILNFVRIWRPIISSTASNRARRVHNRPKPKPAAGQLSEERSADIPVRSNEGQQEAVRTNVRRRNAQACCGQECRRSGGEQLQKTICAGAGSSPSLDPPKDILIL